MSIVEVQDLTKIYGAGDTAVTALNQVSFEVEPGEFVAIMGPSGCGKSTLLHLLAGLDRPTKGCVLIGGHTLTGLPDRQATRLRRQQIGLVFQFFT